VGWEELTQVDLRKRYNFYKYVILNFPTCTISLVKSELINSKPSIASLPLQHQPEVLAHVHGHLTSGPLWPGCVQLRG
jgi:hypothetical protein